MPVDTSAAGSGIGRDPFPGQPEKCRVADEAVHIIEPAVAIGSRPLVQPGLHPQYPFPCLTQHRLRRTGIHRRLFWHCSILLAIVLPPLSMWQALPTSEYYGDSAPPGTFSRRRACPTGRAGRTSGGRMPGGSHVHYRIDLQGRRPALPPQHRHGYAADLRRGLPPG